MKKIIMLILIVVSLMVSFNCMVIAANSPGPADNSGDGISDGSGFANESFGDGVAKGPAPNSGDGGADGSGF